MSSSRSMGSRGVCCWRGVTRCSVGRRSRMTCWCGMGLRTSASSCRRMRCRSADVPRARRRMSLRTRASRTGALCTHATTGAFRTDAARPTRFRARIARMEVRWNAPSRVLEHAAIVTTKVAVIEYRAAP
jgi:hypothetical protein